VIPEVEKALRCLYLACPAEVADDVNRVVKAALLAKDIEIEALKRRIGEKKESP